MNKNKTSRGGCGITIPAYKARALATHLKRIVEKAGCDHTDTRTANALRLAKIDLKTLDKLLRYDGHQSDPDGAYSVGRGQRDTRH